MSNSYRVWLTASLTLSSIAWTSVARSQISSDGTLSAPTQVTTSDARNFTITEGSRVGDNLFHSFDEFSIPTQGSAIFENATDVKNIISRVTGGSISNIDGLIQTNGNANLFFLNPNGIIFGSHASLNINGSFVASTASSLLFADGTQLGTEIGSTSPLLTITVPIGLQFGDNPQPIALQEANLQVPTAASYIQQPTGRTLALVGGDVTLEGSTLTAPGGHIEIGSVGSNSQVSLSAIETGWTLGYEGVQQFQDIVLSQQASIDVSDLSLVFLAEGIAVANPDIGSGDVELQGRNISLTEGSQIASNTLGKMPGGAIALTASETIKLTGTGITQDGIRSTNLNTVTVGSGKAGDLTIDTRRLVVENGAGISSNSFSLGDSGNIAIDALESVEISGSAPDVGVSSISVGTASFGNAGALTINTARLTVREGGVISAATSSQGWGGSIAIAASESVEIVGTTVDDEGQIISSSLLAASTGEGEAGNLTIQTGQLTVSDGAEISVSGLGSGNAGNLEINADAALLGNGGKLTAETASGTGGNINLQVEGQLLLRNNSQISTAAGTEGGGGNGGNIAIAPQFLVAVPSENSDITANAFTGDGGSVNIAAKGVFGIEFRDKPTFLSDITVSSTFGQSGIVSINRPEVDPESSLGKLPLEVIKADRLVVQGCQNGGKLTNGEFTVTGRGGLPSNPLDELETNTGLPDLGENSHNTEQRQDSQRRETPKDVPSSAMVEAQGWVRDNNGNVVLIAKASAVTPHTPGLALPSCPASQ